MAVFKDNRKGHSYLNQKDYVKATTSKLFVFVFLPVYVDRHRGWMQRCLNACINQISTASRCWSFARRKSGRLGFKTVSSGSSDSWPAAGCCLNRFQPEAVNGFNDDVQRLLLCKSSDFFLYLSHLGQPINQPFFFPPRVDSGKRMLEGIYGFGNRVWTSVAEVFWIIQKSDLLFFFFFSEVHVSSPNCVIFSDSLCSCDFWFLGFCIL